MSCKAVIIVGVILFMTPSGKVLQLSNRFYEKLTAYQSYVCKCVLTAIFVFLSLTCKLFALINSVKMDTHPSGVFQNVPYSFMCLPVWCSLFCQKTAQSRRTILTSLLGTGSSFTAYSFKVGACSIFFTAPDSMKKLNWVMIQQEKRFQGSIKSVHLLTTRSFHNS